MADSPPNNRDRATAVPLNPDQAMALLRSADAEYQAGDSTAARAKCEALIMAGMFVEWAQFFLGRIHRDESNGDAAVEAFSRAIDADPALFWAHCERLFLAGEQGEPIARRGELIAAITAIPWEPLADGHIRKLQSIAHAQWDGGDRDMAHRLFAKLWPSPDLDVLAVVRIVESNRDETMVTEAVSRLEGLAELDEIATRILIQHYDIQGDVDKQIAFLESRATTTATSFRVWSSLARAYARRRKLRSAAGNMEQSPRDTALIAGIYEFARTVEESAEPLSAEQVSQVELIAHVLWDAGYVDSAYRLFTRLWPAAEIGNPTLVRIIEADRDDTMVSEAVERLEKSDSLDDNALRILGDHHARHGDVEREIAFLERRRTATPADFQTWLALARSYAKKDQRERAFATLEQGRAFPARQQTFARMIVHVELGEANTALLEYRTLARLYAEVPKYPGIRLAYLFGDAFDVPRRNEILGLLAANYAGDRDLALVEVNVAMRDQRWADARALFDEKLADLDPKPQNVRLANVDILAFSGQLEAAYALLVQERETGTLPSGFLRSSLRILGELERWDEVFALGLEHLGEDASFEHFLSIMIRAARKIDQSPTLFEALLALPQPLKRAQHDALFAVMEDMAERGHHDVLERIGDVEIPYERRHRIELKVRAANPPVETARDLCIYYCADENYLVPALVSLTSLAMSNVSLTRRTVFHLIVDSDIVPLAAAAGGAIARRLGLKLEIVDASTIVSSADRLRTGYGLFTGGQQLSLAAYYRIFFARHLVDQGRFAQALYVDADTVVRGGLEELFTLERTAPIMARYETDRPEVRHATAVHRLQGRYFNSGVLHFDLAQRDLPMLLDRAIAAAIDPDVDLIFQDQCALNIAFDLQMNELPPRFNYFNPPDVSGDGIAATDAVIVHFLDRPKPWDSLYRRRAREWFEWFDLVGMLRQEAPPGTL